MSDTNNKISTGYLNSALSLVINAENAFLINIQHNNDNVASSTIHLKPTPDGSYIIPHQKRNSATTNTYYIRTMDD
jgi:hypothetical protein